MTAGNQYINITSTENFQVKAVYVAYDDPDDSPAYVSVNGLRLYQDPYYFIILAVSTNINENYPMELLSWMYVDLTPAGSGGDSLLILLWNNGDGDETLFVKVIVESAQTAVITVDLVPD